MNIWIILVLNLELVHFSLSFFWQLLRERISSWKFRLQATYVLLWHFLRNKLHLKTYKSADAPCLCYICSSRLFCLFSKCPTPTLTDSSHTIQTVQTYFPPELFSSSFSTTISITHAACIKIYVISFPQNLYCVKIVDYINLYSYYGRLQLSIETALPLPLFNETTRKFDGPR